MDCTTPRPRRDHGNDRPRPWPVAAPHAAEGTRRGRPPRVRRPAPCGPPEFPSVRPARPRGPRAADGPAPGFEGAGGPRRRRTRPGGLPARRRADSAAGRRRSRPRPPPGEGGSRRSTVPDRRRTAPLGGGGGRRAPPRSDRPGCWRPRGASLTRSLGNGMPRHRGRSLAWARPRARRPLMILPQVHLRKPCYDFYFL